MLKTSVLYFIFNSVSYTRVYTPVEDDILSSGGVCGRVGFLYIIVLLVYCFPEFILCRSMVIDLSFIQSYVHMSLCMIIFYCLY